MINGISFDVEDWFNVENLRAVCPVDRWDTFELRVEANTDKLLGALSEKGVKATFFVLGWVARKRPELVKKIAAEGHEVASHGFGHQLITKLSREAFTTDIADSKKLLEDTIGNPVIGYRAPNFSITDKTSWALDVLREAGFAYDSSIFPTSFHDRYGFSGIRGSDIFRFENGLYEIPLSVVRLARLNFPVAGGAYFRLFPYWVLKGAYKMLNKQGKPFVFYLHPWEFDPGQPRMDVSASFKLRHYGNLAKTEPKLKKLLADFSFGPLKELIAKPGS